MTTRKRLVVLASGGGSNLGALLAHLDSRGDSRRADVVAVASDRAGAGALERARTRGIEAVHLPASTDVAGESLARLLSRVQPDLVVLAGYLRLVPRDVVAAYHGRMLNVHPALLPAFGGHGMYGLRVHQAVIDAGARVSGATVHFVDDEFDRGAIIAQWPVPVLEGDTTERLAARVLVAEHALYPHVVEAVAADDVVLEKGGRVRWRAATPPGVGFRAAVHAPTDVAARAHDIAALDPQLALLYPNH